MHLPQQFTVGCEAGGINVGYNIKDFLQSTQEEKSATLKGSPSQTDARFPALRNSRLDQSFTLDQIQEFRVGFFNHPTHPPLLPLPLLQMSETSHHLPCWPLSCPSTKRRHFRHQRSYTWSLCRRPLWPRRI